MPPYAPSVLKRSYAGKYQSASKRTRLSSRIRGLYASRTSSMVTPSRYALAPPTVELKYSDYSNTFAPVSAGNLNNLLSVPNGTGPNERIGRSVSLHDIQFTYTLLANANTPQTHVRIILLYDRQTNGILPNVTDIVSSATVTSLPQPNNRSRFMVLYDKVHFFTNNQVATVANSAYPSNPHVLNKKITLKGKKTEFFGTTGNLSDIDKGALFILALTNNSGSAVVNFDSRIQFFDI